MLCEGDLNSQVCVVASVVLSPNRKASNSVRFDYLGSFLFTSTSSLYRRCTNTDTLNTSTSLRMYPYKLTGGWISHCP